MSQRNGSASVGIIANTAIYPNVVSRIRSLQSVRLVLSTVNEALFWNEVRSKSISEIHIDICLIASPRTSNMTTFCTLLRQFDPFTTAIALVKKNDKPEDIVQALSRGACGYIQEDATPQIYENVIFDAKSSRAVIDKDVAVAIENIINKGQIPLTEEQYAVLSQISKGRTYEQIAKSRNVTKKLLANEEDKIKGHIFNIIKYMQNPQFFKGS